MTSLPAPTARFVDTLDAIPAEVWNALRGNTHPLLAHEFLGGLERHGCLQRRYGWKPHHLVLEQGQEVLAVAPCYQKANSHGEFVFDQGWAEAYHRYGFDYYPKLLCAIPYSPVNGPRLLCGQRQTLAPQLLAALEHEVGQAPYSSAHINFLPLGTPEPESPWLSRHDYQFHWSRNGASTFDEFLRQLNAKKRKNIQQERRQVRDVGIEVRRFSGDDLNIEVMRAMHAFYLDTFDRKGNLPVLTPAFFQHVMQTMPNQLLIAIAYRNARPIAGAMFMYDDNTLFGRYWGASEAWPGLHFELCYYQGIEFAIERGIDRFEPGAQGEHKVARGFLPTLTRSWHYIADPRFRQAIARSLEEEARWVDRYAQQVAQHTPFRRNIEIGK